MSSLTEQATALLNLIPETGAIGNVTLRRKFLDLDVTGDWPEPGDAEHYYSETRKKLLAAGLIKLGRGKGGSVRRSVSEQGPTVAKIRSIAADLKVASLTPDENGNFKMYPQPGSPLFGKTPAEAEEIINRVLASEISYPTGSLGEHVPDATGDSSDGESF